MRAEKFVSPLGTLDFAAYWEGFPALSLRLGALKYSAWSFGEFGYRLLPFSAPKRLRREMKLQLSAASGCAGSFMRKTWQASRE